MFIYNCNSTDKLWFLIDNHPETKGKFTYAAIESIYNFVENSGETVDVSYIPRMNQMFYECTFNEFVDDYFDYEDICIMCLSEFTHFSPENEEDLDVDELKELIKEEVSPSDVVDFFNEEDTGDNAILTSSNTIVICKY